MNQRQRIRELINQATITCMEFDPAHAVPAPNLRFNMLLSELIVRECAEIVRIQNEQFMENESHYGVVSTDVLKHFGFE